MYAEMSKSYWTTLIPDLGNTSVGKRQTENESIQAAFLTNVAFFISSKEIRSLPHNRLS